MTFIRVILISFSVDNKFPKNQWNPLLVTYMQEDKIKSLITLQDVVQSAEGDSLSRDL